MIIVREFLGKKQIEFCCEICYTYFSDKETYLDHLKREHNTQERKIMLELTEYRALLDEKEGKDFDRAYEEFLLSLRKTEYLKRIKDFVSQLRKGMEEEKKD